MQVANEDKPGLDGGFGSVITHIFDDRCMSVHVSKMTKSIYFNVDKMPQDVDL